MAKLLIIALALSGVLAALVDSVPSDIPNNHELELLTKEDKDIIKALEDGINHIRSKGDVTPRRQEGIKKLENFQAIIRSKAEKRYQLRSSSGPTLS